MQGAQLEITETAGRCRCGSCGSEFEPAGQILLCPCGSAEAQVLAGQELKITSVQVA
jgi:hydrogenase nickel incorporation protein HypA/HybF